MFPGGVPSVTSAPLWLAPPSMACALQLSAADTHVAVVSPSPLRGGKYFLKGGGGRGDRQPEGRPHLSRRQTKDKSSVWSIPGGVCLSKVVESHPPLALGPRACFEGRAEAMCRE